MVKLKLFVVSILIFNSCYSMEQNQQSLSHENAQLRNENAQLQEIIRLQNENAQLYTIIQQQENIQVHNKNNPNPHQCTEQRSQPSGRMCTCQRVITCCCFIPLVICSGAAEMCCERITSSCSSCCAPCAFLTVMAFSAE